MHKQTGKVSSSSSKKSTPKHPSTKSKKSTLRIKSKLATTGTGATSPLLFATRSISASIGKTNKSHIGGVINTSTQPAFTSSKSFASTQPTFCSSKSFNHTTTSLTTTSITSPQENVTQFQHPAFSPMLGMFGTNSTGFRGQMKDNKRMKSQLQTLSQLSFSTTTTTTTTTPQHSSTPKQSKTDDTISSAKPSEEGQNDGNDQKDGKKKGFLQNNKIYQMYKKYGKRAILTYFGVYVTGLVALTTVPLLIPSYEPAIALNWMDTNGYIPEQMKMVFNQIIERFPQIGEPIKKYPILCTNLFAGYLLNELATIPRIGITLGLVKKFAGKKEGSNDDGENNEAEQTSTPTATTTTTPKQKAKLATSSPSSQSTTTLGDLPPYTNRPEDLEGVTAASGRFVKKVWEIGVSPDLSGVKLSGEIVTDGKVSFDKAALSVEGVFPTRDEEVAQLQKAIDLKKDAAAATEQANVLHEEHNKLYESGDKDGAKGKLAESKTFRAKAQEIHQESFDLAYAGAMSMAIKAVFSKYPSIDYHVFLVDPYEKSYLVAIDMMKKYGKYGRKDFMVIPGEGQHSGSKGPLIRPHFEKWMADNKITNEQVTPGSYALKLDDVKM